MDRARPRLPPSTTRAVRCAAVLGVLLTACGGGAGGSSTPTAGPVDGTYTGTVADAGGTAALSFSVSGGGTVVAGIMLAAQDPATCRAMPASSALGDLETRVGTHHVFAVYVKGFAVVSGHLDGRGFAQGVMRVHRGTCLLQGAWTASDAGVTAITPHLASGRYSGVSIILPDDVLRIVPSPSADASVNFTVDGAGDRLTGVTAGVFNDCAGEGAYISRAFPDAGIDTHGAFSTTAGDATLTGHVDGDGFASGVITTVRAGGRCGDDGSTWGAQNPSG